ncbi:MAG TPA: hypothetical protein VMG58_10385, partial [Candidatus Sulfotelmatobacter sp.]|nr:hypothetical protein [Candidatus Sulfotelmatobacter sp.]
MRPPAASGRRLRAAIARRLQPTPREVCPDDVPPLAGLAVVDLGCGLNPHPDASAVVEPYLDPVSRAEGVVDAGAFTGRGVRFV